MRKRLLSACLGSASGFAIGILLWSLDFYIAKGQDHLLGMVIGLTLGCGIMALLFPISGISSFFMAGLRGIFGYGGTLPDPAERRGKDRD
jgi:hypothetical protein